MGITYEKAGWTCSACKRRHHNECTKGDCACAKCYPAEGASA